LNNAKITACIGFAYVLIPTIALRGEIDEDYMNDLTPNLARIRPERTCAARIVPT
jgi:hypothetical protein